MLGSLQSFELGPSTPSPAGVCCSSPPLGPGGRHTRCGEEGVGGTQFRRKDRHSGTVLYVDYNSFTGGTMQRHYKGVEWIRARSRQSAKLFLQPLELVLPPPPHPLSLRRVSPSFGSGGKGTLGERGVGGGSQFQRGDIHCVNLCMYVLCGLEGGNKKKGQGPG